MTAWRLVPESYRPVLFPSGARPLLAGIAGSYLGDGMSAVTIAWLALQIAPPGHSGVYVGAAVAAYGLPTIIGPLAFGRLLARRSARALVVTDSAVRAVLLATIAVLWGLEVLSPAAYLVLLVGAPLLAAWGVAGKYTLLSEVVGPAHRLAVNAIVSALGSAAVIAGPAVAGVLIDPIGPGWLIAGDAATFAYLAVQAARTRSPVGDPDSEVASPIDTSKATAGLRIIREHHLLGLLALSWFFFFLYGPVEVALPVHVVHDLHAGAATLGAYWALFGVGALIGSLATTVLRHRPPWTTTFLIAAGWGLCLLPFGLGAPTIVTMLGLAIGGVIYGPFTPLTYALFQAKTTPAQMSMVLAARGAIMTIATPAGTALGGPLTAALGADHTLAASGLATIALVAVTAARRQLRQRKSKTQIEP